MTAAARAAFRVRREERGRFAMRGRVHPFEISVGIVDGGRLRNLIEDRAHLGHLAYRARMKQRVVERERGVASDFAEERDLFVGPLAPRRLRDAERPRLAVA